VHANVRLSRARHSRGPARHSSGKSIGREPWRATVPAEVRHRGASRSFSGAHLTGYHLSHRKPRERSGEHSAGEKGHRGALACRDRDSAVGALHG
jgi:hypothetical protein